MRSYVLSIALLLVACEKHEEPSLKKQAAAEPAPAPSGALPPGHPAVPGTAAVAPAPTEPPLAGGLTWTAPDVFLRRAPKSSMRAAEYGLKGSPNAELGVFYFGADQGGTVDANITRWVGQFTQPDGSETKAKRAEKDVNGIKVSTVEASGMYGGGMAMPGAPVPSAQPDAMLLGAIAKGPQGSVFFKFTGPKADLENARGPFDQLLGSITQK